MRRDRHDRAGGAELDDALPRSVNVAALGAAGREGDHQAKAGKFRCSSDPHGGS
jgi:hypothetical protein